MAGTIEFIQNAVKLAKPEWKHTFPAIDDILIIHNTVLVEIAPMYFQ